MEKSFAHWGRKRHITQALTLFAYFTMPLQFDLDAWRIHFFGLTLVPGLFHIFYLAFLLPFFALLASSALYSKAFCGWVCPQNIFYELFTWTQNSLSKYLPTFRRSERARAALDLSLAIICGFVIAWTALSYFKGADPIFSTALFTVVFVFFVFDNHWLKHKFCKNACPYAFIQKSFAKKNSLHVSWENRPGNKCGICRACEKACYVDLNPRFDAFHLDCTMCGACIDACDRVYARKPEPSLLSFDSKVGAWSQRFVVGAFLFMCCMLSWAILTRPTVSFRVERPTGGQARQLPYLIGEQHANSYRVLVRNLDKLPVRYELRIAEPGFLLQGQQDIELDAFGKQTVAIEVLLEANDAPSNFLPINFELWQAGQKVQAQQSMFRLATRK